MDGVEDGVQDGEVDGDAIFSGRRLSSFFRYLGSVMDGGMHGVEDGGKDGARLCSGWGWVRNIIRFLQGYNIMTP